jgi:UDP-N-acetylglucosamine--N-acetylmuramyl-(pentapeptide) pyrophosphoryl-undecaprenol N-acetylglucosamine transferase
VLTGGGTGGHVFPLIAVAQNLQQLGQDLGLPLRLYYVGPTTGPFSPPVDIFTSEGIVVKGISAGSFSSSGFLGFLGMLKGFFQSLWHLYFIMPDVTFSKGGYGSLPVVLAGAIYWIPLFIHESDAIPGKVNQVASKIASRIAVSFSKTFQYFPEAKTGLVGNPVRREFFVEEPAKAQALDRFGLANDRKTILVIGGSQGAKILNDITLDILTELLKKYQIIHICGLKNFPEIEGEAKFLLESWGGRLDPFYKLYGFLDAEEVALAYAASDLVLARGGSGLIFEIAAMAKPSIIVPFSVASRDHQRENAYEYAAGGAALVVEEENLKPNILLGEIEKIMTDGTKLQEMSGAAKNFSMPNAAETLSRELLILCGARI